MISKYTYKNLTWIDIESPTQEEIAHIAEEWGIPPLVKREIKNHSLHSKVDVYKNFIYLVLHFPTLVKKNTRTIEKEVDFIIGKNSLITVHYEPISTLEDFAKTFEDDMTSEHQVEVDNGGIIFFNLIKKLYTNTRADLHSLNIPMKEIEDKIFSEKEDEMVKSISGVNRTLLDFKQALRFHQSVLNSFEMASKDFFKEEFTYYSSSISAEYLKTKSALESHKEILNDLKETNDSLLASKTNMTIKFLTVITFIISPVMIFSNIFVINSKFLENETLSSYYIVLGAMFLSSLIIFIFFKKKKWL